MVLIWNVSDRMKMMIMNPRMHVRRRRARNVKPEEKKRKARKRRKRKRMTVEM